jgi:tRNA threonylcarbamoyladenosine biosynthesis protein TsaB
MDKPSYTVGSGWDAYPEALAELKRNDASPDILFPSAVAMLVVGAHKFSLGQGVSAEHAQPVYVRDTVSWKKLPGKT